jgi:hypothetical protein
MIRFIDLRGQDTAGRFTFFDTVTDRFEVINGQSVWNTFNDLEYDIKSECHLIDCSAKIERHRNLCPDWASDIAEMVIENVQDRCTEFMCDKMVPLYALMSTETRTALVKELGRYMDIEQFNVCGLEVVVHNAIEYGNVKVVGEPWVK